MVLIGTPLIFATFKVAKVPVKSLSEPTVEAEFIKLPVSPGERCDKPIEAFAILSLVTLPSCKLTVLTAPALILALLGTPVRSPPSGDKYSLTSGANISIEMLPLAIFSAIAEDLILGFGKVPSKSPPAAKTSGANEFKVID